jgi:hypothetical protein
VRPQRKIKHVFKFKAEHTDGRLMVDGGRTMSEQSVNEKKGGETQTWTYSTLAGIHTIDPLYNTNPNGLHICICLPSKFTGMQVECAMCPHFDNRS